MLYPLEDTLAGVLQQGQVEVELDFDGGYTFGAHSVTPFLVSVGAPRCR
jgi:hypothetical protein